MIAASQGGGNKSNGGLLGLFKIFLNFFYLDLPDVACEDEKFAHAITN